MICLFIRLIIPPFSAFNVSDLAMPGEGAANLWGNSLNVAGNVCFH